MNSPEVQKLIDMIKCPVKDLRYDEANAVTYIEFENGQIVPLYGKHIEIEVDVHICNFCSATSIDKTLYTKDDVTFICADCTSLAMKTFLENGVTLNLDISALYPDLADQLKKLNNLTDSREPSK